MRISELRLQKILKVVLLFLYLFLPINGKDTMGLMPMALFFLWSPMMGLSGLIVFIVPFLIGSSIVFQQYTRVNKVVVLLAIVMVFICLMVLDDNFSNAMESPLGSASNDSAKSWFEIMAFLCILDSIALMWLTFRSFFTGSASEA